MAAYTAVIFWLCFGLIRLVFPTIRPSPLVVTSGITRSDRPELVGANLRRYCTSAAEHIDRFYISSTLLFVRCSCPAQSLVDENSLMMTTAVSFK